MFRRHLSIPAWFDWRPGGNPGRCAKGEAFNPSLVRLAPDVWEDDYMISATFQSQLGSIGACYPDHLLRQGDGLSIPAWFDWRPRSDEPGLDTHYTFNPSLVRLAL